MHHYALLCRKYTDFNIESNSLHHRATLCASNDMICHLLRFRLSLPIWPKMASAANLSMFQKVSWCKKGNLFILCLAITCRPITGGFFLEELLFIGYKIAFLAFYAIFGCRSKISTFSNLPWFGDFIQPWHHDNLVDSNHSNGCMHNSACSWACRHRLWWNPWIIILKNSMVQRW